MMQGECVSTDAADALASAGGYGHLTHRLKFLKPVQLLSRSTRVLSVFLPVRACSRVALP